MTAAPKLVPRNREGVKALRRSTKSLLARELRRGLELDGLTQEQLAEVCGVNQSIVSDWHNDREERVPNAQHVRRASDAGALHWALAAARCQVPDCHVLPMPRVVDEPESARTARVTRELLDVPRVMTAHLALGERTVAQIEHELTETLQAVDAGRKHAAYLQRELQRRRAER